jgi:hypothetical protein
MSDKTHKNDASKHTATDGPSYDDRGTTAEADQEAALRAAHIQLAENLPARVLRTEVKDNGSEIVLSAGLKRGVVEGMTAYLAGSDGKPRYDVVITHVEDGFCRGFVEATTDEVSAHQQAVINPMTKPAKPAAAKHGK